MLSTSSSILDATIKHQKKNNLKLQWSDDVNIINISSLYFSIYFSYWNIVLLILALSLNALNILKRRALVGPKRKNWSLIHEVIVETMQYNYKWHLDKVSKVPIPWDLIIKNWNILSDYQKLKAIDECLNYLQMTEQQLLAYCCVHNFQRLILFLPSLPYWPWAHFRSVVLPAKYLKTFNKGLLIDPQGLKDLRVDFIRDKSVSEHTPRIILFSFGGAYNFKIEASWHSLVLKISRLVNAIVVVPHYRLAPQNRFPAAIDDLTSCYNWLITSKTCGGLGYDPKCITIVGESAGAGALVSMCLRLFECDVEKPVCAVLMSPWLDLSCSEKIAIDPETLEESLSNAWNRNQPNDILHVPVFPFNLAENYISGLSLKKTKFSFKHHLVSPFHATSEQLENALPPLVIQVGECECLVDEGILLAKSLSHGNFSKILLNNILKNDPTIPRDSRVVCEVYEDMTHVFQIFNSIGYSPSNIAISRFCSFINRYYENH